MHISPLETLLVKFDMERWGRRKKKRCVPRQM